MATRNAEPASVIAKWVGLVEADDYNQNPRDCLMKHGAEIIQFHVGVNPGAEPWQPDTDITLWHGPGRLLEKIEAKGLIKRFLEELLSQTDFFLDDYRRYALSDWNQYLWFVRTATPAQLTAALVATIKEQHADVHPA